MITSRRGFLGALLVAPAAGLVGKREVLVPVAAIHDSIIFERRSYGWDTKDGRRLREELATFNEQLRFAQNFYRPSRWTSR